MAIAVLMSYRVLLHNKLHYQPAIVNIHTATTTMISTAQRKILVQLARFRALGLTEPKKVFVARVCGFKQSFFKVATAKLKSLRYVETPTSSTLCITDLGCAQVPHAVTALQFPTLDRALEYMQQHMILRGGSMRILQSMVDHPQRRHVFNRRALAVQLDVLATIEDDSPRYRSFKVFLSALKVRNLVDYPDQDTVCLSNTSLALLPKPVPTTVAAKVVDWSMDEDEDEDESSDSMSSTISV